MGRNAEWGGGVVDMGEMRNQVPGTGLTSSHSLRLRFLSACLFIIKTDGKSWSFRLTLQIPSGLERAFDNRTPRPDQYPRRIRLRECDAWLRKCRG